MSLKGSSNILSLMANRRRMMREAEEYLRGVSMNSFKRKENGVWEDIIRLIADTTDDVAGKATDLYMQDGDLLKYVSKEKLRDISFECALLLTHILDEVLVNRRPDIRVDTIQSVYRVIPEIYPLNEIARNAPYQSEDIIEDRMQRYGMIVRGEWNPAAFWWLGEELKEDNIIQCLALYGDYITFFRFYNDIPLGDDIEPVILVNPLDRETLAVSFIVFQILAPAVTAFEQKLDRIIQGAKDGSEITFSVKKSRGVSEEDYRRAMHITSLSLWSKELKEIAQVMGKTPVQTKKYFEEIVRNYNLAKYGGN